MDVEASRHFKADPGAIASVMFNPHHDPEWIGGAKAVEILSGDPPATGARVKRTGGFLGKSFSWTTEIREHAPERLLRMDFIEGPMTGEVVYRIEPEGTGSRVSIRNKAKSSFSIPGQHYLVRLSVSKDLQRLEKIVLEAGQTPSID